VGAEGALPPNKMSRTASDSVIIFSVLLSLVIQSRRLQRLSKTTLAILEQVEQRFLVVSIRLYNVYG